jgi:hypothetical protein
MLTFWTAPLAYRGADAVDITRKSGRPELGLAFAPSWALLGPAIARRRQEGLTREAVASYRTAYLEEMRRSYRAQRGRWDALLSMKSAVLTCYCTRPAHASHCHRLILAWILCQLGATYRGEVRTPDRVAVGIIGGRERQDLEAARAYVQRLSAGAIVVHGGSPGLEQAAALEAEQRGLQHICLPITQRMVARWGRERAQWRRDQWIAKASDCLALLPGPKTLAAMQALAEGRLAELL